MLRAQLEGRKITLANEAFATLMAQPQKELIGIRFTDFFTPHERAAIARRMDDVIMYGDERIEVLSLMVAKQTRQYVALDICIRNPRDRVL